MKTQLISLFMFLTLILNSQNSSKSKIANICGHVKTSDSGKGLHKAKVQLFRNDSLIETVYTNNNGDYCFKTPPFGKYVIKSSHKAYENKTEKISITSSSTTLNDIALENVAVHDLVDKKTEREKIGGRYHGMKCAESYAYSPMPSGYDAGNFNTEEYKHIQDNEFKEVNKNPLSTMSIDVDRASYSNVRRLITNGSLPPADAVRIEEMINYFSYSYKKPKGKVPFSIQTEYTECAWNKEHRIVHIGIQGKEISTTSMPANNLVFLLDVSGSMMTANKLPLVKSGIRLLVEQMRPQDRISIVVYAGAAGLVLPSTSGSEKDKIMAAIEELQAGGSTAGGAGIKLAYNVAKENFIKGGNNRVILATDGDFNIGARSDGEMVRLIEEKRESGVYLTVLGFGTGNYKDAKMEQLADKGNGNYAYIDNIMEAKKVLVNEMGGTLVTIAKDVKIQIEFNPAKVKAYRLVGYENRVLANEDFNDDKKDAGELGAGHTVTALYEIIPAGSTEETASIDPLKYQVIQTKTNISSNEILTVKFRYKEPNEEHSKLITEVVDDQLKKFSSASENCKFASAVSAFGMLLRDSKFKGQADYKSVLALAKSAKGKDEEGYRAEFIRLVEMAEMMAKK
ncbi:MAG: von Willebrand factor type A domain-containing protein [Sphingobacteriaceae bacterium]|nr:von Willebrand factor type A domain-containing protein [Sphingobacteriaceae bacterium]